MILEAFGWMSVEGCTFLCERSPTTTSIWMRSDTRIYSRMVSESSLTTVMGGAVSVSFVCRGQCVALCCAISLSSLCQKPSRSFKDALKIPSENTIEIGAIDPGAFCPFTSISSHGD